MHCLIFLINIPLSFLPGKLTYAQIMSLMLSIETLTFYIIPFSYITHIINHSKRNFINFLLIYLLYDQIILHGLKIK